MQRAIVPLKDFSRALTALGSGVPPTLVPGLACRIAARPECWPFVRGGPMRMLQTRTYGEYPAVNLFYRFDDEKVYLTHIELRDELEVFDEVELWREARV